MGRGKRNGGRGRGSASPRGTFNPQVVFDPGEISVSLPELGLIGSGPDFEAAKADLVEEIHVYAEQFSGSPALQGATNRRDHARLLDLIAEAEAAGTLDELLYAPPPEVLAGASGV